MSFFKTFKTTLGKTKTRPTEDVAPYEGHIPLTSMLPGAICTTTFFDEKVATPVAVLFITDERDAVGRPNSQTGVVVKVQRWDVDKQVMYGGTVELDKAWLRTTGNYWHESGCPFDDDIPF